MKRERKSYIRNISYELRQLFLYQMVVNHVHPQSRSMARPFPQRKSQPARAPSDLGRGQGDSFPSTTVFSRHWETIGIQFRTQDWPSQSDEGATCVCGWGGVGASWLSGTTESRAGKPT